MRWSPAATAGGAKIGRTRGVVVRDSDFSDNDGTGLWFDESTYDIQVLRSSLRDNRGHGLAVEISALATVAGNVLAQVRPSANCLLCVEDYSERFSAEDLHVNSSGNVYQRPRSDAPTWAVVWSRGYGDPYVFDSVAEFTRATGQEQPHLEVLGEPAVGPGLDATAKVQGRAAYVALPLPDGLAHLLHRSTGGRRLVRLTLLTRFRRWWARPTDPRRCR